MEIRAKAAREGQAEIAKLRLVEQQKALEAVSPHSNLASLQSLDGQPQSFEYNIKAIKEVSLGNILCHLARQERMHHCMSLFCDGCRKIFVHCTHAGTIRSPSILGDRFAMCTV